MTMNDFHDFALAKQRQAAAAALAETLEKITGAPCNDSVNAEIGHLFEALSPKRAEELCCTLSDFLNTLAQSIHEQSPGELFGRLQDMLAFDVNGTSLRTINKLTADRP